jgi:hypothetical protein
MVIFHPRMTTTEPVQAAHFTISYQTPFPSQPARNRLMHLGIRSNVRPPRFISSGPLLSPQRLHTSPRFSVQVGLCMSTAC